MPEENSQNIAVIIERLDNLKENMERRTDEILTHVQKTNGRVSALEIALAIIKGKAAILGTIAGGVVSLIILVIGNKFFS